MLQNMNPPSRVDNTRGRELAPGENVRLDVQQECTVNRVPTDKGGAREAGNVQLVLMQAVIKTIASQPQPKAQLRRGLSCSMPCIISREARHEFTYGSAPHSVSHVRLILRSR
jgi:hypothetical protein